MPPTGNCVEHTKSQNDDWQLLTLKNIQRYTSSLFAVTNASLYFEFQPDGTYVTYYKFFPLTRAGTDYSGPTFSREDYGMVMPFILHNLGKPFWTPIDHEYLTGFTGSQNESVCAQMINTVLLCNGALLTNQLPNLAIHEILSCIPQTVFRIHGYTAFNDMDDGMDGMDGLTM